METIRNHIYLAALLHDIGKFYQRADKIFSDKENELSDYSKKLANNICPINEHGRFGYQHVVWTNEFLEKESLIFEKVPGIKQNLYQNNEEDSLPNFACNHHSPKTELQAIITLADWWSVGIDRREPTKEDVSKDEPINWGRERYKLAPLFSIFNEIAIESSDSTGKHHSAFPLKALSIEKDKCFPHEVQNVNEGVNEQSYKELWNKFEKEIEHLPTDSFNGFAESLLYLLKKYTWCIPSNTMDMANVSLFEHLKTTAALADCLYLYKTEHPQDFSWDNVNKRLSLKDGVCPVLFVGGDLSGIQKFIYNIASNKAAVSLKGRSFYLQLLIDSVIQRIISHPDIDANIGNVVYSSGGKFYMFLPNTEKVCKAIADLKKEFEQSLWDDHNGQLLLNLDYVPFAYSTKNKTICFEKQIYKTLGDLWKRLADKLSENKNQKFKSVLTKNFDTLFEPIKVKGDKICAVTGIESETCVKLDPKDKEEKPTYVLPIVKKQADLGNVLKDVDYVLTYKGSGTSKYLNNRSNCNIVTVGTNNYLFDQKELTLDDAEFRKITSADVTRIKRINETAFLATQLKGQKVSYGFQFYGGNKQAEDAGKLKTFENLADNTYLGILRMDVDNLSKIFIKGLRDEDKSFAAYATLSFLLDYFFSGYLNTIRNSADFKDDVNILYSGGDDVFAVGRWDKLILFAQKIRKEFERFVGREDISISGGIAIVGNKFPVAKAAELAGEAEKEAKSFNNESKNAFNMLGETVSWDKEFDIVREWQGKFITMDSKYKMPRSILHKIMQLAELLKHEEMKYIWHTVYFLKRFSENKDDGIKGFCDELQFALLGNSRNFELIALAARWAELELKLNS
jgi:CRISPR-associated protein Csm1